MIWYSRQKKEKFSSAQGLSGDLLAQGIVGEIAEV
jgi:hypothetical protein